MSHLTPWAHEPDAELVGTGERLTFPGGSYYSAGTYLGNEVPALGNEVPALGNEVPV
ncbi:hypothetical protein A2U01_0069246, partial [Trifolium medium]|nr:hypothetical protein [Trifolium medium]